MFKGLQNYTDYMVKAVHPVKNGYGFRIVLKYEDGTEKTQQRAGFSSKKEAEEERCITIGELKNRAYLVYANVLVKDYFIHWLEDDVMARRNNYNTYRSYINIINKYIIPAARYTLA